MALPKAPRRLPQFLTVRQMVDLLGAPLAELRDAARTGPPAPARVASCLRDVALLETIYSCGLRVGEICRLHIEDLDVP